MIQVLATLQLAVGFQEANIGERAEIKTYKSSLKSNYKKVMNLFLLQQLRTMLKQRIPK